MIKLSQLTKSSEISALSDYYILDVRPTGPNPAINAIDSVSLLQVSDDEIVQKAVVRIAPDSDREAASENGYYRAPQVADSMARLLTGQVVVSEPAALQFLRVMLEHYGHEGELFFIPIGKLASSLFPDAASDSILEIARLMEIPEQDNAGLLRTVFFEYEIFNRCCIALGGPRAKKLRRRSAAHHIGNNTQNAPAAPGRISSRTLKRWAKNIWSVSPWVVVASVFLVVFVVIVRIPRKESGVIDRNVAPVNYIVLSWDQTGRYGSRSKARAGEESVIQFRVPYGVYNVLNNNSIPVTLSVVTDEDAAAAAAQTDTDPAVETENAEGSDAAESTGEGGTAENDAAAEPPKASEPPSASELIAATLAAAAAEEESGPTTITMRPNSSRQITIDVDQYLTLSDAAKDLILFYVSEVPEVKESDTTGYDDGNGSRVVYAYIKGTEVRFRKSPSLEGAIIDVMQNGQQVQVLGVTGEWTHVQVQGDKGYIFSQFLTSEDPQAAAYAAKLAQMQAEAQGGSTDASSPEPSADTAADSAADTGSQEPSVPAADSPESSE